MNSWVLDRQRRKKTLPVSGWTLKSEALRSINVHGVPQHQNTSLGVSFAPNFKKHALEGIVPFNPRTCQAPTSPAPKLGLHHQKFNHFTSGAWEAARVHPGKDLSSHLSTCVRLLEPPPRSTVSDYETRC